MINVDFHVSLADAEIAKQSKSTYVRKGSLLNIVIVPWQARIITLQWITVKRDVKRD